MLKATRRGASLPLPGLGGRGSERDSAVIVTQPTGLRHTGPGGPGAPGEPGEWRLGVWAEAGAPWVRRLRLPFSAPPLARAAPSHSSGLCADVAPQVFSDPPLPPWCSLCSAQTGVRPRKAGTSSRLVGRGFLPGEGNPWGTQPPPLKSPGKAKASGCHQPWEPLGQPVFVPPREAGAQRPRWAKGLCPGCVLGPRRPAQQRKCSTSGPGACPEVRVRED